jgi:LAO/AO transport system kinase
VQVAKAGILEMADVFVVNKADKDGATEAARDLEHMLGMGSKMEWTPPVVKVSAATGEGVDDVWTAIENHRKHLEATGRGTELRLKRLLAEVKEMVSQELKERAGALLTDDSELVHDLQERRIDPYGAVAILTARVGGERVQGVH